MPNEYYNHGSNPATGSSGSSAVMRSEFDLIMAGFAKLPPLTAQQGRVLKVNPSGTAITLTNGELILAGLFETQGGHALTFITTNTTTITLPSGTSTLVGTTASQTLTNKTIAAPIFSGTSSGTYTLAGTISITAPAISAPVLSGTVTGTYTLGGSGTINTGISVGHAIGSSGASTTGVILRGAFTGPGGGFPRATSHDGAIVAGVGDSVSLHGFGGGITKAGSGTHSLLDTVLIQAPTIGGSGATVDQACSLRISAAPTGATLNYALRVEAGTTYLNGLLDLSGGSAGQIKFPSTAIPSADVNTLDDYEEGNWTPTLGGNATYTSQIGRYVKIGKMVFISGALAVNAIGTGSTTTITGLPFTAQNVSGLDYAGSAVLAGSATSVASIISRIANNGTSVNFPCVAAAGAAGHTTPAIFQNSTGIVFTIQYIAAN